LHGFENIPHCSYPINCLLLRKSFLRSHLQVAEEEESTSLQVAEEESKRRGSMLFTFHSCLDPSFG